MKRTLVALAVLGLGASAVHAQEVIKLGTAAPLTGTQSHLGKDIENGVRLAIEDYNAKGVTLGIISPDGRDGMVEHARQFKAAGVPFIFDPGQGLPMFNGAELLEFLRLAT